MSVNCKLSHKRFDMKAEVVNELDRQNHKSPNDGDRRALIKGVKMSKEILIGHILCHCGLLKSSTRESRRFARERYQSQGVLK